MLLTFVGCCKNSFSALQPGRNHSRILIPLMCIVCLCCRGGEGIIHSFRTKWLKTFLKSWSVCEWVGQFAIAFVQGWTRSPQLWSLPLLYSTNYLQCQWLSCTTIPLTLSHLFKHRILKPFILFIDGNIKCIFVGFALYLAIFAMWNSLPKVIYKPYTKDYIYVPPWMFWREYKI